MPSYAPVAELGDAPSNSELARIAKLHEQTGARRRRFGKGVLVGFATGALLASIVAVVLARKQ